MRKLLVASQKGGVGKTVTAVSLAATSARPDRRTLLFDADPLGGVTAALNLAHGTAPSRSWPGGLLHEEVAPGLDVLRPQPGLADAETDVLRLLEDHAHAARYAAIIIDGPPLRGRRPQQLLQACDEVLLVLRAEAMSYRTLPAFLRALKEMRTQTGKPDFQGILLTLPPGTSAGGRWETELRRRFGERILPQVIPHDPSVARALLHGQAVTTVAPEAPASCQYRDLTCLLGLASRELLWASQKSSEGAKRAFVHAAPAPTHQLEAVTLAQPASSWDQAGERLRLLPAPVPLDVISPSAVLASRNGTATTDESLPVELASPQVFAEAFRAPVREHSWQAHAGGALCLAVTADGRLATGGADHCARLWDPATGASLSVYKGHTLPVTCLALSPDGRLLATGSQDRLVKVWELDTGREVACLKGHTRPVSALAFSPDGSTLASGSQDKTVKLWDVAAGRERRTLSGHVGGIWSVAFAPGNGLLVMGGYQAVKLWNAAEGRDDGTLRGHTSWVLATAFSPDGTILASAGEEGLVRLWERTSGRTLSDLRGHSGGVWSLSFATDGQTLASGGRDATVRLWGTDGAERAVLRGHSNRVWAVGFLPEGGLASAGGDGAVRIWDVPG